MSRNVPGAPRPACYYRQLIWRDDVSRPSGYPFDIPAVRDVEQLRLDAPVTFLVGENGSGKSTLLEAIAVKAGFHVEGGTKNFVLSQHDSMSDLSEFVRIVRDGDRPTDGFFLRAESFYNVATKIDAIGVQQSYGGRSLHQQSHGEAFISLLNQRLQGGGFYVFDEPEAALSPQRQLAALVLMHRLVLHRSQLVIATHSPILMAYPGAAIYQLDEDGIRRVTYEETDHYVLTRRFLNGHAGMVDRLIREEEDWFGGTLR